MSPAPFEVPPPTVDFPRAEESVLSLWSDLQAFQTSLRQSREAKRPKFSFYDGPPFATGLPHYGHILAGSIKDIITRWMHQVNLSLVIDWWRCFT